jgi:transcriptional regulator with XRE-family HTH domain
MTRLAETIGVDLRSVSVFEKSEFKPSEENLNRIAAALRFPIEFFMQEGELQIIDRDSASFRSLFKMSASQRDILVR